MAMSESTTIARPYAKAIFEHADEKGQLAFWSDSLSLLSLCVKTKEVMAFVQNPRSTSLQKTQLLTAIFTAHTKSKTPSEIERMLEVLASNRRLLLIPEMAALFEIMKADKEKTTEVLVSSSTELSTAQREKLVQVLSKRLQRKVSLQTVIDPSLIGGAMIRAGDLVIDGSVRGKLNTLSATLIA